MSSSLRFLRDFCGLGTHSCARSGYTGGRDALRDALPRVRRRASIGREQTHKKRPSKTAETAFRRTTPVARERNPTTSLAQERGSVSLPFPGLASSLLFCFKSAVR